MASFEEDNRKDFTRPRLDRLCCVNISNNVIKGVPYKISSVYEYVCMPFKSMIPYRIKILNGANFYLDAEEEDYYCEGFFGKPYDASYTFSTQYMRPKESGGNLPVQSGRLQFRRWSLLFGAARAFKVKVEQQGQQEPFVYNFEDRRLSTNTAHITELTNTESEKRRAIEGDSGSFTFPVKALNERVMVKVENNTPYHSKFTGVEWEAFYNSRAVRV